MNTHLPFNSSGDTLDGFKFTFDFYLDDKARIEADVSPLTRETPTQLPVSDISQPNPTNDDFDSG